MKLIQTKDYLLLIDEEAEINFDTDYIHAPDTSLFTGLEIGKIKKADAELATKRVGMCFIKVIAYYPLTKEAEELDLPLLPSFEIDVDELAEVSSEKHHYAFGHQSTMYQLGFLEGYKAKAAQSKQFSLEDMYRIAIEVSNRVSRPEYGEIININEIVDTYVQSLSNKQLPKFFIPEENYGDGALTKYKTIINSEGKEEIQGKYVY